MTSTCIQTVIYTACFINLVKSPTHNMKSKNQLINIHCKIFRPTNAIFFLHYIMGKQRSFFFLQSPFNFLLATCSGQCPLSNHQQCIIIRLFVEYDTNFCNRLSGWLKQNLPLVFPLSAAHVVFFCQLENRYTC